MSQALRQTELFSGEDWTVLYRAFNQINFNAYDPQSINAALRQYIQTNYPEDFNDWIESSEFVAIIDLLSWLAGSLAFRTDVNARENFLEVAQARESVLRLARFLSYNPRRAQSARGMVKITEVRTTQSVVDSFGVNLNNTSVKWNDPDNPDWMEQFTLVLNATFPSINPYGVPLKSGTLGGATTQLYAMNTARNPNCVYSFGAVVDGSNEQFELVNVDFEDEVGFSERTPDPANSFHMLYRNDGKGNASTRTGFFLFFKQGSINQQNYTIVNPIENRLIDIDTNNISETDVWFQTLDDSNNVTVNWTKVPAIFSQNITFNEIDANVRDIFSVITRDDDTVSLRFSDGRFGAVPIGNLKVWFRTVNGRQYQIRPRDMENITVTIPYVDTYGRSQDLTIKFSLQETVSNALASETIDQIRERAPQVYGTQNRMVSGEDYNVFPLSSNEIVKMRAVNRVYSGHSRFIDINDPTATLQDTTVLSQDGILYKEFNANQYTQVSLSANYSPEQMVSKKIQPMLEHPNVKSYFLDYTLANVDSFGTHFSHDNFQWKSVRSDGTSSVGYFDASGNQTDAYCPYTGAPWSDAPQADRDAVQKFLSPNAKIKFEWQVDGETMIGWAKVMTTKLNSSTTSCVFSTDLTNPQLEPVTLDESIPDGAVMRLIVPPYRATLDTREMERDDLGTSSEVQKLEEFISLKKPFKLWYVIDQQSILSYSTLILAGQWHIQEPSEPAPEGSAIVVLSGSYNGGLFWSFETAIGTRYVFESVADVRWHDLKNHKVLDSKSGVDRRDAIKIVWPEYEVDGRKAESVTFDIVDNVYDPDGLADFRKVVVVPTDSDADGVVDVPDSFDYVANIEYGSSQPLDFALFQKDLQDIFQKLNPRSDIKQFTTLPTNYNGADVFVKGSTQANDSTRGFYTWNESLNAYEPSVDESLVYEMGRSSLRFQWDHFAGSDVRIDPAVTNIIDIFVLTSEYDFLTRQWIKDGTPEDDIPAAPSDLDLKNTFQDFEQYKMFSDQLVWRPVKYKYLFGSQARPEVQAQFKIVRLPNTSLSDGEIRSRVIQAINDYFDVNKWEFGETFYYTELAAYLHIRLAAAISSVVIVPLADNGKFGELFEVRCDTDEVFISTAQVEDVVIIDGNTMANLRIS